MMQFCPRVGDDVTTGKCNLCNLELVGKTQTCCRYINCLTTCDYKDKESCVGYKEALLKQAVATTLSEANKGKK